MENFNKFMDQKDPTKKIDTSSVTLEEQYSKLTDEDKLYLGCKSLNLSVVPCTIDQFIEDSYFMGCLTDNGNAVFPFWREKLREIFPNQIFTRYPMISLGGSVGTGSTSCRFK